MSNVAHPPDTRPTRPADEAWIDPRPAIMVALDARLTVDDDVAELLWALVLTMARLLEERDALREVRNLSVTQSHQLTVQIWRLEAQRNDLLARMRSLRTNAEPCR